MRGFAALSSLWLASLLASSAGHAVECGDVIAEPTVLTEDIGPCGPEIDPVLTVIGPATLDLNGHVLDCRAFGTNPEIGILVEGHGAVLRNGTVRRCSQIAVQLAGAGRHLVENVIVADNSNDGFGVSSHRNRLVANVAVDNHDDGFFVTGRRNELARNVALDSGSVGFAINGARNLLRESSARSSQVNGISVRNRGNRIVGNVVFGNGSLAGISVGGDSHIVRDNQVLENEIGIRCGATNTRLVGNTTFANQDFDLTDEAEACDGNVWRSNLFATANQPCID